MKGGIVSPKRLIDVSRLPGLDRIEPLPDGGVRIGARVRNADLAYDPDLQQALPGGRRSAALRRLGPAAQRRDRRRQPAATHALRLFLRPGERLQQAAARRGLRRARRREPAARRAGLERVLHRHASVRFLRAARRAGRRGRDRGAGGPARGGAGRIPPAARHHAGARERAGAGRTGRRRSPAGRGDAVRRACPLPEAPRAHLLRLRRGFRRGLPAHRGRVHCRGAAGAGRRGGKALACPSRGGGAGRRPPGCGGLPPRCGGGAGGGASVRRQRLQDRARSADRRRARWPSLRPERPSACPPSPPLPSHPFPEAPFMAETPQISIASATPARRQHRPAAHPPRRPPEGYRPGPLRGRQPSARHAARRPRGQQHRPRPRDLPRCDGGQGASRRGRGDDPGEPPAAGAGSGREVGPLHVPPRPAAERQGALRRSADRRGDRRDAGGGDGRRGAAVAAL